jgi:opacity protein-like surface antigen
MSRQQRISSQAAFAMALVVGLGALLLGRGLTVPGAHAQEGSKRVVVVPFEGSGGGKIAETTAEILKAAGYTVVSDSDYRDAARKLDARGRDSAQVARVAAEMQLTAVLFGEIDKGASRLVKVQIHAGATGAQVAVVEFEVKRRRLTPEEEETVRTKLLPALAGVTGAPPPPPSGGDEGLVIEGETEGTGSEGAGTGGSEGTEGAGTTADGPPVAQADDTDVAFTPDPLSRSKDTDDGEDETKAAPSRAGNAGLELAAGISFTSRVLRSEVQNDVVGPTYDGPPAPALFLGVEAYPATFAGETLPARFVLANIGLQLQFERVFGLTSEVVFDAGGAEMSEVLDTTQMRIRGGLVYRLRFGDDATSPVLELGVGYERFQFELDRDPLPAGAVVTLPDVTYSSVDPGLDFRYPVNDRIAVTARGRLLLILDPGDLASPEQYGDTSSTLGFDVGLDVEYLVTDRIAVRLGARFMDVTIGFEGNGMLSNNLDGDMATQDVDGITDFYLGALLTGGYLF